MNRGKENFELKELSIKINPGQSGDSGPDQPLLENNETTTVSTEDQKNKEQEDFNKQLHDAAKNGDSDKLKEMIENWKNSPLNTGKNDDGDTPMITLLKECAYKCKLKVNVANQLNEGDKNLCTNHNECFEMLRKHSKPDEKNKVGLSAISFASICADKKRGYLDKLLNSDCENEVIGLHEAIQANDDVMFVQRLNSLKHTKDQIFWLLYTDSKATYTLLQAVSKKGMLESYKELLKTSPDYAFFRPLENHQPIQLSCLFAKPLMLKHLLPYNTKIKTKNNRTLLHLSMKNSTDFVNSYECLKILLNQTNLSSSVNDEDSRGRTPLYYALLNGNEEGAIELLNHGAYLDVEDKCKQTLLMHISKDTLKRYLNSMINETKPEDHNQTEQNQNKISKKPESDHKINKGLKNLNNKSFISRSGSSNFLDKFKFTRKNSSIIGKDKENSSPNEKIGNYPTKGPCTIPETRSLSFNFKPLFLNSKLSCKKSGDGNERKCYKFSTEFLRKINELEDLQELLSHPVLSAIIYFKWRQICHHFLTHILLYFIFCVLYTWYIVSSEDQPQEQISTKGKLLYALGYGRKSKPFFAAVGLFQISMDKRLYFLIPITSIILFFVILEFLKIIHIKYTANKDENSCFTWACFSNYVTDVDNVIRVIVMVLSITVIICQNSCITPYCPQIKAVSILMTWIEFFLVLGKFPNLSFYVTIFRSAFGRLLKFIAIHFSLLIGFALSFHILFRTTSSDNVFYTWYLAIFKTIVMLTSEFDASDIPFNDHSILSRFIFIFYIFIATFVLFNLMIGIAFKRVAEMEQNPFLYKCIAQISIIKHYEDIFRQNVILERVKQFFCMRLENENEIENIEAETEDFKIIWDASKKNFTHLLEFKRNPRDQVFKIKNTSEYLEKLPFYGINIEVIKRARKIVAKNHATSEISREKHLFSKLEAMANKMNELEKLISNNNARKRITVK